MKLIFESLNKDKIAINEGVFKTASLLVLAGMTLVPMATTYIENRRIKKYGPLMKSAVIEYIKNNKPINYTVDVADMYNLDAVSIICKYKLWTYQDALKFNKSNSAILARQYQDLLTSSKDWAFYDGSSIDDEAKDAYMEIYNFISDKNSILICNDSYFKSILMLDIKNKKVVYISAEDAEMKTYNYDIFIESIVIEMYDYLADNNLINKVY